MLVTTAEIDEIRKEPGEKELRLYLVVERGEWLLPRALWMLQEKLNAYASWALDGLMQQTYPWAKPENVRIVVRSHGQAPKDAVELIEKAGSMLAAEGPMLSFEQA